MHFVEAVIVNVYQAWHIFTKIKYKSVFVS